VSWNLPDGTSDADIDAFMDPPVYCPGCDTPVTDGVCEWCGPIEDDTSWSPDWLAFAAHRGVEPDDESLTAADFTAWSRSEAGS